MTEKPLTSVEALHKKNFKPINIRDLFMEKNPSLAGWIPGFVYRLLSRILWVDFMNYPIFYEHGYKKNVEFARASIDAFNVRAEVRGREHLPPEGRFLFVANHPLGGFDGSQAIENVRRISEIMHKTSGYVHESNHTLSSH